MFIKDTVGVHIKIIRCQDLKTILCKLVHLYLCTFTFTVYGYALYTVQFTTYIVH